MAEVTEPGPIPELLQRITDIAAAAGDRAALRVLTADGQAVEHDLVSPSDPDAKAHFIFAPVRHDGGILGFLHVFRADPATPFEAGDDDHFQVLADRVGTVVAEHRARRAAEHHRAQGRGFEDRLTKLTAEQRELLDQLTDVEQRERTLLAQAIHDDPIQLIVAAIMRMDLLGAALPTEQAQEMDQLANVLETAVGRLRMLIVALIPPNLTDGLAAALRDVAEGIFVGTTVTISMAGRQDVALPATSKDTAYRIVREGLVNARKHSQARHITLSLDETDDSVIIRLVDDGIGAAALHAGPGHLGLATMRGRAANEGGHLDIHSEPGNGTTVVLTLPKQPPTSTSQQSPTVGPAEQRRKNHPSGPLQVSN